MSPCRYRWFNILGLIAACTYTVGLPTAASVLEDLLWRKRVLILVAPVAVDPAMTAQLTSIDQNGWSLEERDVIVVQLFNEGVSRMNGQVLASDEASRLRASLHLQPSDRLVLLLGKDGRVKRRDSLPVDLRAIFNQIDAMPMRRSEIRRKIDLGIAVDVPHRSEFR